MHLKKERREKLRKEKERKKKGYRCFSKKKRIKVKSKREWGGHHL